jgi:hypothetical protein
MAKEGLSAVAELPDGQALPRSALQIINAAGFIELILGHLVEAQGLLERCAANGGLTDERDPEQRALLLCNLAAAAAGLGDYRSSIDWASQAEAIPFGARTRGWSCVYLASPDWPKSPRMVFRPDISAIARGTQISALAMLGDLDARNQAETLLDEFNERWACELLAYVARTLGDERTAETAIARAPTMTDSSPQE